MIETVKRDKTFKSFIKVSLCKPYNQVSTQWDALLLELDTETEVW